MTPMANIEHIRHSLAHVLAAAVLQKFPHAKLGVGPVIENGFYYDILLPRPLKAEELPELEKTMKNIVKKNLDFIGREITLKEGEELFKDQPFKKELLGEFAAQNLKLTAYKTGNFLDLCRGGHVKNTSEIDPEAFKLVKLAGAYWRGDENNPQLQRVYGVAFETKKELDDHLALLALAEKNDHRVLGERLDFFMIDEEIGRGLPLWLPNGYAVRHKIEEYMHNLEKGGGYLHVLTPHIAKEDLYKKSGHLAHYKEDMYAPMQIDNEKYYLRPMNCPHHHAIYKHHKRSYRELPLRIAEFGTVYRYERSGVLSGLIRTRSFTQNDSHIYTDEKHLEKEVVAVLGMHKKVFNDFHIKDYWYRLSLPDFANKEKYGDVENKEMWEKGAATLRKALKDTKHKFVEGVGEASFYGPKIDIQIKNILGKEDTIATVQVDYYSAGRFHLSYVDETGAEKPTIIVHRAILGSFERFIAFLIEKSGGNLPLWLLPEQVRILAVSAKQKAYAKAVLKQLTDAGIAATCGKTDETLGKRIREAEMKKVPYVLIVGDKETKSKSVAVRKRDKGDMGAIKLEKFIGRVTAEIKTKR